MSDVNKLAKYIQNRLIENGFTIQRLNAKTTNSIYFKLDYGLCNSVRISDHKGKKGYAYRFNILKELPIKTIQYHSNGKFPRYFYSFDIADKMVSDIIKRREEQIQKFGAIIYEGLQLKNKKEKESNRGFWLKAKLVGE